MHSMLAPTIYVFLFAVLYQGCDGFCVPWKCWGVLSVDRGISHTSDKSQVHRGQIGGMPN